MTVTGIANTPKPSVPPSGATPAAEAPKAASQTKPESEPKGRTAQSSITSLGDAVPANAKLKLDIDSSTGRVIGRIVDKESGEEIKQIPSEKMLKLIAETEKLLGSLYDEKL